MQLSYTHLREQAREALWPLPAAMVVVAVGAGIVLPQVDEELIGPEGHPLEFAFGGGPSAARDLMAAIAGSLISVTALVFSLTIVALQLASSQYSPRLLQNFSRDKVVQGTLACLVATFVYALTVLRTIRTESATEGEDAFVPRLAITVASALALCSVLALTVFIGHLARSLRVETMLKEVHEEGAEVLARERDRGGREEGVHLPTGEAKVLEAPGSGFLVEIDEEKLVRAAREGEVVLRLDRRIGDQVIAGTPIAHLWGEAPEAEARFWEALVLRYERSTGRDTVYSLRKVVDIAVRALSPGINDPTTAVHALSHAAAMLADLLEEPYEERTVRDEEGEVRLIVPTWNPAELLALTLEEPLLLSAKQPAVLRRMAQLVREVAWRSRGRNAAELRKWMRRIQVVAQESPHLEEERKRWGEALEDALERRWAAGAEE